MIVAKEPRSATPCIFEEVVEEEVVEVVTLLRHLPISSTSTTALREKVGLRERNVNYTTEICDFCFFFLNVNRQ